MRCALSRVSAGPRRVKGVFDLRPAAQAALSGGCLNAKQLEGVANSLESAFEVRAAALARHPGSGQPLYPSLAALAQRISEQELATVRAIRGCIRWVQAARC
jgi:DNA mismatch repair protein MutS2